MEKIFNKYFSSINEEMDLAGFESLAASGETNVIDRKSIRDYDDIDKNKNRILTVLAKALSAFSNYEGGILLIGVEDNGNTEEGIVNNLIGRQTVKEWLENVLWTCVSPPARNYSVKYVIKNSKFLYAIFIYKSETAPHQAAHGDGKFKYFSRVSGQSQPIDGVLVRDIFNRQKYANLEPLLKINPVIDTSGAVANMEITIINKTLIPGEKVTMLMKLSEKKISGGMHGPEISFAGDSGQFFADLVYPQIPCGFSENIRLLDFNEISCNLTIVAKNMLKKDFRYLIRKIDVQNFAVISIQS